MQIKYSSNLYLIWLIISSYSYSNFACSFQKPAQFVCFSHTILLNLKQGRTCVPHYFQYFIMKYCICLGIDKEFLNLALSFILSFAWIMAASLFLCHIYQNQDHRPLHILTPLSSSVILIVYHFENIAWMHWTGYYS